MRGSKRAHPPNVTGSKPSESTGFGAALLEAVQQKPLRPPQPQNTPVGGSVAPDLQRSKPTAVPAGSQPPKPMVASPSSPRASRPTPLPKRPKGQWLIGSIVLALCATVGYILWNAFGRFEAYGSVQGRVIEVSSPIRGFIQSLACRSGDWVKQGQILATVHNLELQQKRERLRDEISLALADLQSELAQIQLRSQERDSESRKASADYYTLLGQLEFEKSQHAHSVEVLRRLTALRENSAATEQEFEHAQFQEQGLRKKVDQLSLATTELLERISVSNGSLANESAQIRPHSQRVQSLEAELSRIGDQLELGQIRAPVTGRIIEFHLHSGEAVDVAQPLCRILEDGSVEVVLYVPQQSIHRFELGQELHVVVEPSPELVPCQIVQIGERLEPAPSPIRRYFREYQRLFPVHLCPTSNAGTSTTLKLDSEAQLPMRWWVATSVRADSSRGESP